MIDASDPIFALIRNAVPQSFIDELSRVLIESPRLQAQLVGYKNDVGYPIGLEYIAAEGGHTDITTGQITIRPPKQTLDFINSVRNLDSGGVGTYSNASEIVGILAHELGHVLDPDYRRFSFDGTDIANEFGYLFVSLAGEGKAALNNLTVYNEISRATSGRDVTALGIAPNSIDEKNTYDAALNAGNIAEKNRDTGEFGV